MEVQITSRKLITPSSPTPPHLQNTRVTCFDQLAPFFYVPTIFYYPVEGEEYAVKNAEKSLLLQKSLSEILTLYHPFAGRYARDNLSIECNDKGVEYLEAKVYGSLSQFLQRTSPNHLVQQNFHPHYSSPLAVQFNEFECGGVAIGISMTHKIGDGFTMFTLINKWATACRIGVNKVHPPSFELGIIFPPREASRVQNVVLGRAPTNKIVTKKFVFDGEAISNLKAAASASSSQFNRHQLTRVKVVTALIWSAFIRVDQARDGRRRPSMLKVPVNLRGKTNIKIPENSCGNFISWAVTQYLPNDEIKMQLHELVSRIHDAIEKTVSNYEKASNGEDLFFMVNEDFQKVSQALKESEADVYMFSCWSRFPLYDADFGWGKPDLASRSVQVEREMILLLDTKDGKGIEARVSLEENKMLLFLQDPYILAFSHYKKSRL